MHFVSGGHSSIRELAFADSYSADSRGMSHQEAGTTRRISDSSCSNAYAFSLKCLDENAYDKSKCKDAFEAYKNRRRMSLSVLARAARQQGRRRLAALHQAAPDAQLLPQPQQGAPWQAAQHAQYCLRGFALGSGQWRSRRKDVMPDRNLPQKNEQIRAPEVRVLFPPEAEKAPESDLDVVMLSPKAEPPVVRLVEWSKVLYEAQKREKLATKQRLAAQRAGQAREVRIGCQIAEHDLAVKMAQARRFLEDGSLLRLVVTFKGGPQIALGREVVLYLIGQLADLAAVRDEKHLQRPMKNHASLPELPGGGEFGRGMKRLLPWLVALCCLAGAHAQAEEPCSAFGPRVSCGSRGVQQATCEALGCCWAPDALPKEDWQPDVYMPRCFQPNTAPSTYNLVSLAGGSTGAGELVQQQSAQPELGDDLRSAVFSLNQIAPAIVRVKITDANNTLYQVPNQFFTQQSILGGGIFADAGGSPLFVAQVEQTPFSVAVVRNNPANNSTQGATTFNTTGLRLIIKDQYLELSTWVNPSAYIYGAGERASSTTFMTRNGYPYTLWNRDLGPSVAMRNTYGHWPFVMVMEQDGSCWGALLLNSNGMDMVATRDRLTWRAIGGMIDLFVFMGPTPLDVVQQLTRVVGRPALQPYWSLGFHQSKYGYGSLGQVQQVVANYSNAELPLESMWLDIDYMDNYRLFTFDCNTFPQAGVQRFANELAAKGMKLIPIVDPGVKMDPNYATYLDGLGQSVYLRGQDLQPYVGWVWPGGVHFPDFGFNPAAQPFWTDQLRRFHAQVNWSGIWTDMNEVANFCTGDVCSLPNEQALVTQRGLPLTTCQALCLSADAGGLSAAGTKLVSPPYQINNGLSEEPLNTKGVGVLASHSNGTLQYNTHNLYGLTMAQATAISLRVIKNSRPFILTRSTYVGSGAYAAHWTGDNNSTWTDLAWSIPGVIASGMAGIPMAGADVCGFSGNASTQLCARWELYSRPALASVARRMLSVRYSLLPYLYTLLKDATQTGAPLFRPLFMNFPADRLTYPISNQFMVGDALMVVPVLEPDTLWVPGYFPRGLWYDLWDNTTVDARPGPLNGTLYGPLGQPPTYLLGGNILPQQDPQLTTAAVKSSPISLTIGLPQLAYNVTADNTTAVPGGIGFVEPTQLRNETFTASGLMFNDDGVSLETPATDSSCCNYLSFTATVTLTITNVTLNTNGTAPVAPVTPVPAAVPPPAPQPPSAAAGVVLPGNVNATVNITAEPAADGGILQPGTVVSTGGPDNQPSAAPAPAPSPPPASATGGGQPAAAPAPAVAGGGEVEAAAAAAAAIAAAAAASGGQPTGAPAPAAAPEEQVAAAAVEAPAQQPAPGAAPAVAPAAAAAAAQASPDPSAVSLPSLVASPPPQDGAAAAAAAPAAAAPAAAAAGPAAVPAAAQAQAPAAAPEAAAAATPAAAGPAPGNASALTPGPAPAPAPTPAAAVPALPSQRRRSLSGFNATFNATTFFPNVTTNITYSAAVEIRYGQPVPGAGQNATGPPACGAGGSGVSWPPLRGLRVLGWLLPGDALEATLEVAGNKTPINPSQASYTHTPRVRCLLDFPSIRELESGNWEPSLLTACCLPFRPITADGRQLLINLAANQVNLQCGQVVRITWSVSWPAPWVPWFPLEAISVFQPTGPPANAVA
ncbi:Alpha-glucosidase [Chlorella vulgaris]